jgi:hypothetical protein
MLAQDNADYNLKTSFQLCGLVGLLNPVWFLRRFIVISIPVTPFGMGSGPLGVVRGGMWNY